MTEPMHEKPEEGGLDEAALKSARASSGLWMLASILLFFFGLPAGCFGCAAAGGGGGVIFPFLAGFANVGAMIAWMNYRGKLPPQERNGFAVFAVLVMGVGILAFLSIMAAAI